MPTIFGPDWESLGISDVQGFLDGADPEPLVWEAKGTDIDRHQVRRAVCGFGNSHETGYLILGADYRDGSWRLDGYEFPDEPPAWIDSVVRTEVRPTPFVDVRSWRIANADKQVAVVQVQPVATPPCITRGTVYERVPGRTIPVKDPQRLGDLYTRGEQAHIEAQEIAQRLRRGMLWFAQDHHPMYKPERVQMVLTGATTGYRSDLSSRLFTQAFRDKLWSLSENLLVSNVPQNYVDRRVEIEQTRHRMTTAATADLETAQGWIAEAVWNGAVGIYWVIGQTQSRNDSLVENVVAPACRAAVVLLEELGGYGPTYVALSVCGGGHPRNVLPTRVAGDLHTPGTNLDRGPIERRVEALDLASVKRELDRALGIDAFEPEAEPPEQTRREGE